MSRIFDPGLVECKGPLAAGDTAVAPELEAAAVAPGIPAIVLSATPSVPPAPGAVMAADAAAAAVSTARASACILTAASAARCSSNILSALSRRSSTPGRGCEHCPRSLCAPSDRSRSIKVRAVVAWGREGGRRGGGASCTHDPILLPTRLTHTHAARMSTVRHAAQVGSVSAHEPCAPLERLCRPKAPPSAFASCLRPFPITHRRIAPSHLPAANAICALGPCVWRGGTH